MKIKEYQFGFAVKRSGNYQSAEVQNTITVTFAEGEEPETVEEAQQLVSRMRVMLFHKTDKAAAEAIAAVNGHGHGDFVE